MDKLGKSLDQLITESSTQQTRRPQQQQQRQRHNQNQQNQKRDAIDKRRDLHRDNRPQSAGKIESSTPQRDFKVVTIERPRVVETSHARGGVPSTGSSVFNRLGSDEKTIVVFDNLRSTVSERDVRDLCSSKGKITDVFLLNHPSGTKSARVSFENADDARKCVAEYNGLTLDGLPMRLSVASALPVSTVFSRIQQPTGNSFQVSAAAPTAVPALTAINNLPVSNGNRGGLFGTALPKQQQQQPQQHHNAPHQGSRRVEVQSEQNNFKRERKEKVRNVKGRSNNQSQNKSRRVEENDEDLDEVLDNYFARK